MEKPLHCRWLICVICVLLFFNQAKAICNILPADTTVNITCGDSFTFGGVAYYLTVTQTDTFTSIHGCDSIVTLHLTVTDTINIFQSICAGDSILFYGNWAYQSGGYNQVFYDTLIHTTGVCDSLVILTLQALNPPNPVYVFDTICAGDSLLFNGVYIDTGGIYTTHINPPNACDSTVILNLAVRPAPVLTFTWDSLIALGYVDSVYYNANAAYWSVDVSQGVFMLTGGSPPGGYYTGVGVVNDTFNARQASGFYNVSIYGVTDANDTITYIYCGGSTTAIIELSLPEGIPIISDQYILNLYPNPAQNYLTIAFTPFGSSGAGFTTNSQIQITDVLGRTVKTEKLKDPVSNMQVDVHELINGLYFLRIVDENGVKAQQKFSIMR